MSMPNDVMLTPTRPSSALGLDFSPGTLEMLTRFTEFEATALGRIQVGDLDPVLVAMEAEPDEPVNSGRFANLVHRTVSPLRGRSDAMEVTNPSEEPVIISDSEEDGPPPEVSINAPTVAPEDDPPPPYGSWEEEAPPTYEEACGLLSRRVLAPQDRPPGRLLGRRRREPGTQSDSNEDEAEPSPPPRSWLTPELDMGPSTSAEAQRRREAVQGRSGPAGLAAPHTTSPPVGTVFIEP
ncbi:hypothetical protein ACLKA6_000150 [Drosophila palustris]